MNLESTNHSCSRMADFPVAWTHRGYRLYAAQIKPQISNLSFPLVGNLTNEMPGKQMRKLSPQKSAKCLNLGKDPRENTLRKRENSER